MLERRIKSTLCKHVPHRAPKSLKCFNYQCLKNKKSFYLNEPHMSRRPAAALIALICKTITEEEKFETKDSSTRGTRQKPVEILHCHAKQSRENSPRWRSHHKVMTVKPKHSRWSGHLRGGSEREINAALVHLLSQMLSCGSLRPCPLSHPW